jgi:hypothetical protein
MWWKCYIFLYEDGRMRPIETIPGMGGRVKENDGEGEFN